MLTNVLHLYQFQKYFQGMLSWIRSEFESFTAFTKRKRDSELAVDPQKFKPRILICAPSNAAVDNVLERIMHDGFLQVDLSRYSPDVVRLASGEADVSTVARAVSVEQRVKSLLAMSASDWGSWYSRQYHTVTTTELRLKEKLKEIHEPEISKASDILHLYEIRDRALGDLARLERLRPLYTSSQTTLENTRVSREIYDHIFASFFDEAEIVCCTLTALSKRLVNLSSRRFHAIIVDEACQAIELGTLIPLTLWCAPCVLVGDPKQLPATVKSQYAKSVHFDMSLFERLVEAAVPVKLLTVQYRMHPHIRLFPSSAFYLDKLVDAHGLDESRCLLSHARWPFKPYMIFDVSGEEQQSASLSRYNEVEATFIVKLLLKYHSLFLTPSRQSRQVVVLSGYREQCVLISKLLHNTCICDAIDVSTIDAFQGRESDIIVLSCVRTSASDIGFLADLRRLNVGLTRARCSLWIVCKCDAVSNFYLWQRLLEDAKERGCYTDRLQEAIG